MGQAYTLPLTKVNKMENNYREDTKLMIKLKKRIDKDTEALNILKQKYRDESKGKDALFGSAWTYYIKVKAIQKVKPILNTNEARLIINLAFNQKWINKKTHSNCFKIPAVRKQEVSIWSK
tara:strand:- start:45 stop:407 length:363 start_codon:yes stop_codon:yes gene_type:complete